VGSIIVLPEEVSGKIAAGEVIEGPFSVVRELIDNSLDADANQITITVNNGGKDFILVSDNGYGMSEEDAILSVKKHTTSKIKDISDLDNLNTMGFRGEALSSICIVSELSLLTRREEDETGIKISYSFGNDLGVMPAAANRGTEITVKNLFFNLPARRKFLKSNRAESVLIKDEVLKKALSFFERGFFLKSDDRVVYSLIPRDNERQRITDIYGTALGDNLQEVRHSEGLFSILSYISNHKSTLSNRRGQFIFLNRRPIFDRSLFFALNNPARGIVPTGRYVYAFIYITINPSLIDVNVHPAKKEIKIKEENKICSVLHRLVEKTLQDKFYPSFSYGEWGNFGVVKESHPDFKLSERKAEHIIAEQTIEINNQQIQIPSAPFSDLQRGISEREWGDYSPESLLFRGTLFQTYLVFQGSDFILLIDQHAAHERVLYEKYKDEMAKEGSVKRLLVPINFTPPMKRYSDVVDNIDVFKQAGIEIEPFGDDSFNILTIPGFIPENKEEEIISIFFDEFYEGMLTVRADEIKERFLKLASCRNAIKEGDVLKEAEARSLLKGLGKVNVPYVCPHGRPTTIRISKSYFEKAFKRR